MRFLALLGAFAIGVWAGALAEISNRVESYQTCTAFLRAVREATTSDTPRQVYRTIEEYRGGDSL